jgi:hypothetical protein
LCTPWRVVMPGSDGGTAPDVGGPPVADAPLLPPGLGRNVTVARIARKVLATTFCKKR